LIVFQAAVARLSAGAILLEISIISVHSSGSVCEYHVFRLTDGFGPAMIQRTIRIELVGETRMIPTHANESLSVS